MRLRRKLVGLRALTRRLDFDKPDQSALPCDRVVRPGHELGERRLPDHYGLVCGEADQGSDIGHQGL